MNDKSLEIMAAAMQLPEAERVLIVERLLESLSPDGGAALDDSWEAELERRLADFKQSEDGAVSWEELKEQK